MNVFLDFSSGWLFQWWSALHGVGLAFTLGIFHLHQPAFVFFLSFLPNLARCTQQENEYAEIKPQIYIALC